MNTSKRSQYLVSTSLLVMLFIFGNPQSSTASSFSKKTTTVEVSHRDRTVKFENSTSSLLETKPPIIAVPRGVSVKIKIVDNNPLLFLYDDEVTLKDSQDYEIFKKFLKVAKDTMAGLTVVKAKIPAANNQAQNLKESIKKIKDKYEDRSRIIDQTLYSDSIKKAKTEVMEWNLDDLERKLALHYEEFENALKTSGASLTYEEYDLLQSKKDLNEIIIELKKFAELVGLVNNGFPLKNVIDITDTRKVYTDKITIKANPHYRKLLSDRAAKVQNDNITILPIDFERKSFVRFAMSAGAIYSFVENPEFKVEEDKEGNRTISQTSNDYNEFSGAVAVNVIPDIFFETNFEPFLQLGASAGSGDVGLLLGVGSSFFPYPEEDGNFVRSFTFSLGVIWQEVQELGSGLSVGDSLTTHDDLKIEDKWDSGLYLMLGINF